MTREHVHKRNYVIRDFTGPPKLLPLPIGAASSPYTPVPKAVRFEATQNDEIRRQDLTTVAFLPYPAGYPSDDPDNFIHEIRSHYLDDRFEQWQVLVGFYKTMSAILRHDNQSGYKATRFRASIRSNCCRMQYGQWPISQSGLHGSYITTSTSRRGSFAEYSRPAVSSRCGKT